MSRTGIAVQTGAQTLLARGGRSGRAARVRALVGWNNEDLRPEETRNNPYAEESGWTPMVGVEGAVRRNLFRHIDIHGDFGVSFLQDYTEYRLNVGLVFDFEGKR